MPYKGTCASTCKNFEKSECNPPRCKYVNGEKLKYCRLSHKYKMNKPKCNVTRRIKPTDIEKNARETIGRMMKKSGKFLQTICSDSGVCIAFGKNSDEITSYFNGFTDFKYAISPIKKIGYSSLLSSNGFMKEIEYERQGYRSYAILKSSQDEEDDNLVYEYLVGNKFVNRNLKKFPCFLETYGLYFYGNEMSWKRMQHFETNNKNELANLQIQNHIDYSKACEKSKYAAILMQHMNNSKTMGHHITSYTHFLKNDLLYMLFIVYHALSSLSKQFTHYKLHHGNVLLYEPVKGKHIQYVYHNEDGTTITFNSPYMPKIINYGRSFFDNGNVNSKKIHEKICQTKQCDPRCGDRYGFSSFNDVSSYLDPQIKNESHDLRLLFSLQSVLKDLHKTNNNKPTEHTFLETEKITKKVVYGVGISYKDHKNLGTEENMKHSGSKIHNVNDAYIALKKAVENDNIVAENNNVYNDINNKIGTLHVYNDGRQMMYQENEQ